MHDDDLDALYRALPVARPPAHFADRFAAPPRRRWGIAAVAALAAAALVFALLWPAGPREGAIEATAATTVQLADRATAVADPGARLSWSTAGGAVVVDQPRGRVFYRVDDGPLSVRTPAGEVAVRGTCFTVEVEEMSPALQAGLAGALVGALVTVAVYEGTVTVTNPHGAVELSPGQAARATAAEAPRRVARAQAARDAPVESPAPETPASEAPAAPSAPEIALRAELQAMRAELDRVRADLTRTEAQLAQEQAIRVDREGEPIPFPPNLPERFGEQALRRSVQAAIEESGLDGEVVSVDCSEFPCVVYADFGVRDEDLADKLMGSAAMAGYEGDGPNISAWGRLVHGDEGPEEGMFLGLAFVAGEGLDVEPSPALRKRLDHRNRQAVEAFKPEEE